MQQKDFGFICYDCYQNLGTSTTELIPACIFAGQQMDCNYGEVGLFGIGNDILEEKQKIMDEVACDDTGDIKEYVGCKVDFDTENLTVRLTQPVLIQSFIDEFNVPDKIFNTPGVPGTILNEKESQKLTYDEQKKYQKAVG